MKIVVDDMFSLRCWLEDKALAEHIKIHTPPKHKQRPDNSFTIYTDKEAAIVSQAKMEAYQEVIRYITTRNRNQWPHKKAGSE